MLASHTGRNFSVRDSMANGTWLDPEDFAYMPGPMSTSKRRFSARLDSVDGPLVKGRCGVSSTASTIPATVKYRGKNISGVLVVKTVSGSQIASEEDPIILVFLSQGKNAVRYKLRSPVRCPRCGRTFTEMSRQTEALMKLGDRCSSQCR